MYLLITDQYQWQNILVPYPSENTHADQSGEAIGSITLKTPDMD